MNGEEPGAMLLATALAAAAAIAAAAGGTSCGGAGTPAAETRIFETPGWADAGEIRMRLSTPGGRVLLLRHAERLAAYAFDAASGECSPAASGAWDEAEGAVLDRAAERARAATETSVRADPAGGGILVDGARVPTTGPVVLDVTLSGDGGRVAVLSAEGPRTGGLLPGLGGGGNSRGAHVAEVFSRAQKARLVGPIPLPFTTEKAAFTGVFGPEGRFLVYTDVLLTRLCVVPVDPSIGSGP